MAVPERRCTVLAYIGLGSNLDDPRAQLCRAIHELAGLPGCTLRARSSLYATAPLGPVAQPEFVNAVAVLTTKLTPLALLGALQGIERDHGRVRDGARWGPRTLDLDLLLYGDWQLQLPGLTLPHPEMARRAFVLVPLAEIAPAGLLIPGQGDLAGLLAARDDRDGIRPLPDGAPTGAAGPSPLSSR
ncbi:2-amino-4-hydroxy-6-hydroxymethyldihydropteridine diphosphokinase [uncultured Thiodictyon sp.]|uniref:2-amino-4-hydroxy-6- hydroxymethyldihydropteridine diphosphokinase n=1 Tax=uncultured Thiodictyon sp. TaxID=1846217 RepID=UPI0025E174B9|nr:2-amino-4-hydroxy-6-hydroxymethyldihydropteridine diphosphokinase [uncultured Thiodictyon sp.]